MTGVAIPVGDGADHRPLGVAAHHRDGPRRRPEREDVLIEKIAGRVHGQKMRRAHAVDDLDLHVGDAETEIGLVIRRVDRARQIDRLADGEVARDARRARRHRLRRNDGDRAGRPERAVGRHAAIRDDDASVDERDAAAVVGGDAVAADAAIVAMPAGELRGRRVASGDGDEHERRRQDPSDPLHVGGFDAHEPSVPHCAKPGHRRRRN